MNHNAHSLETWHRREKCIATNSITANTGVPMIHRALYGSSFSHERGTKYSTTKNVKGTDPLFYISSILLLTSLPTPAATLLQFLSSGPVQSIPSPHVAVFFPSLPYPPLPFLVKLFLFTSITSFFIIAPIEWNSAYWDCIFRKGRGPGATYLGHIHLPGLFSVRLVVSLARSAGHNVQIINLEC